MTASTEPVLRGTVSGLCLPFCSSRVKIPPPRAYRSRCLIRCLLPAVTGGRLCVHCPATQLPSFLPHYWAHYPPPTAPFPIGRFYLWPLRWKRRKSHPDPPPSFFLCLAPAQPASQPFLLGLTLLFPRPVYLATSLFSSRRQYILSFLLPIIYFRQTEPHFISVLLPFFLTHLSLASSSQPDSVFRFGPLALLSEAARPNLGTRHRRANYSPLQSGCSDN